MTSRCQWVAALVLCVSAFNLRGVRAEETAVEKFQGIDVFQLEYASDPQISPDGKRVVYVRNFMDIMKDVRRSNLWVVNADGSDHRPLTTGNRNDISPRWSPDGGRLAYVAGDDGQSEILCRWMDSGQTAKLSQVAKEPASLEWSPDGRRLAFTMFVPAEKKPFAEIPKKPEGAEWAELPKVIETTLYRADGKGYLKDGYHHVFVLSADGGTAIPLTKGPYHHQGPLAWSADGTKVYCSANRSDDWELQPRESQIFEIALADRSIRPVTSRKGPDRNPVVSPDGTKLAWLGFDDERLSYQITRLSVISLAGGETRVVTADFDRDVASPIWNAKGDGLFFQYDDLGTTRIGFVTLDGKVTPLASHVGGVTIGRPYASGSFSASRDGTVAYTFSRPTFPADVAVAKKGAPEPTRLTRLNDDLFAVKTLGAVEELWCESSHDGRKIQAWIVRPPDFDPAKKHPLILEIHGGPFANYGDRFSTEMQLYAAAGYVVVYANPRGSTGYGEAFGNLIHHNYPGNDFDDLMSAVDAVIAKGSIDVDNLFVTGGSGGGVLTAWTVGKTDRFRAAVSQKPVINWESFVLTSDMYPYFTDYWFPGPPWQHAQQYRARSPLTYVDNVKTPTMLLTGEVDHRTPISESEQFFQALRLRRVDTALVRIPGASHDTVARPSRLMIQVAYILKWFEMHRK